jgi:hypothetical protein
MIPSIAARRAGDQGKMEGRDCEPDALRPLDRYTSRMVWARSRRVTVSPSKVEVDVRGIPLMPPSGWRLYTLEEWPLIGAAPKGYLAFGDPERPDCPAYIAKKGRLAEGGNRECVTEEIMSKIGSMLPVRMAESKLVRLQPSKHDAPEVRLLSRNFLRRGEEAREAGEVHRRLRREVATRFRNSRSRAGRIALQPI